jgi:hypothetical protein
MATTSIPLKQNSKGNIILFIIKDLLNSTLQLPCMIYMDVAKRVRAKY